MGHDGKMVYPSFKCVLGQDAMHRTAPVSHHRDLIRSSVQRLHRYDFVPCHADFGFGLYGHHSDSVRDKVVHHEHVCTLAPDSKVERDQVGENQLPRVQVADLPSGLESLQCRIAQSMRVDLAVAKGILGRGIDPRRGSTS